MDWAVSAAVVLNSSNHHAGVVLVQNVVVGSKSSNQVADVAPVADAGVD